MRTIVSMDELMVRVSQWSPGFEDRIKGATEEEIQELTELVGWPLAIEHRQFLARMGHGDGGVDLALRSDGSYDISDVIQRYQYRREEKELLGAAPWEDSHCVILVSRAIEPDISLESRPGQMSRVVFASPDTDFLCAESLTGYLGREAFSAFRQRSFPCRLAYGCSYAAAGKRQVVEDARQMLLQLGFVEQWFSDDVCFSGEREDAVVIAEQYEGFGFSVIMAARDLRRAEEVGTVLSEKINIQRRI